jgi:hypothetical protein
MTHCVTTNKADWRFRKLQDLQPNGKRTVYPEKEGKPHQKKLKTNENTLRVRTSRRITGSSTAMGEDRKELGRTWRLTILPSGIHGHRRGSAAERFWSFMNDTQGATAILRGPDGRGQRGLEELLCKRDSILSCWTFRQVPGLHSETNKSTPKTLSYGPSHNINNVKYEGARAY